MLPRFVLTLVIVACCLAATGPAAQSRPSRDGGPLERFSPVLRYDSSEEYFAQPATREANVIDDALVYGHVARQDGERWLQYWLFYAYNSQDRGVLRTGRHKGDWEFVQLRLGPDGRPDTATFAQHSWAEACSYDEIEIETGAGVAVPVVYVANGSHASYPHAGIADRPWPDPNDEADGEGRTVRPALKVISDRSPDWVRDPARWGSTEAGVVPGEQSSPQGPRYQPERQWERPASFHENARTCGSGPPGRPWLMIALLLAILGVVGLVAATVRRRRAQSIVRSSTIS